MREALVIVDMQQRWIRPDRILFPDGASAVACIDDLRKIFSEKGHVVVHSIMEHAADGSTLHPDDTKPWNVRGSDEAQIVEELKPRLGEIVIPKSRYSAFFGTALLETLRNENIAAVTVVGYQMRACVFATVLDAHQHGFRTEVVAEAILETDATYRDMLLKMFQDAGGLVTASAVQARLAATAAVRVSHGDGDLGVCGGLACPRPHANADAYEDVAGQSLVALRN